MSDLTVNARCSICGVRFPMDDGVPCDCHSAAEIRGQEEAAERFDEVVQELTETVIGTLRQWNKLSDAWDNMTVVQQWQVRKELKKQIQGWRDDIL